MPVRETTLYKRTQFGASVLLLVAAVIAFVGFTALITHPPLWMFSGTIGLLLLFTIPLLALSIRVTNSRIDWWFLFGILRQSITLSEIVAVGKAKTSFANGFGIRVGPTGVLWTVGGPAAVTLSLKDGKTVALSSPEPDALVTAIDNARKSQH